MTADALSNALVHVSWYARESGESPVIIIITTPPSCSSPLHPAPFVESNYKSQSEEYRVNYRCAGHCKMDINPSEMKVPVAIEEDRQHVSHSFKPATLTRLLLLLLLCC